MEQNKELHLKFMQEALKEAAKAKERGEIPVGAVVVIDGKIVARAHNLTETLNDPTAHAEMQAITSATNAFGGKYLTDASVYVTLEPCAMCAAALAWSQVKTLVYGASDNKRGFTRFSPSLLHPKTEVTSGVMEEEAALIVKEFFKNIRER